ncbi:MAG TPA: tRNA pseudouridine(38-40) synthase TruA [Thermoanaerobaculia bacterium]|nr:tRNA pseudouridine(38-40) synthase TruA [Thermoanaerobaculia bacterium]
MTRLLFTLQYLGTNYAGWQTQANAVGVQQVVEAALTKMYGTGVKIEGAGRTDAGVHAAAQRAHADVPFEIAPRGVIRGLNDLLPADIRVTAVEPVAGDFHCRFASTGKTYVYRIWNGEVADVFVAATHAHVAQPLDVEVMNRAARPLLGTHDFAAFTVAAPEVSSTRRTIDELGVERDGEVVRLLVTADGFLRYMVRRIAGSLIEAGRGKVSAEEVARSLEPELAPARWTAPARGLTLLHVRYSDREGTADAPDDSANISPST